jgi:hypothetical protein
MRPFALALLAAAALSAASRARADVLASPPSPAGIVSAGQEIVTPVPSLPADVREFELVLLPESGAPVRLTAEIQVGATEIRWRMPKVAATHARLALRFGAAHSESQSSPSASFEIAPLPARELDALRAGRSEAGYRIETAGAARTGIAPSPTRTVLAAARASASAVEGPPGPALGALPRRQHPATDTDDITAPAPSAEPEARLARTSPLRN